MTVEIILLQTIFLSFFNASYVERDTPPPGTFFRRTFDPLNKYVLAKIQ